MVTADVVPGEHLPFFFRDDTDLLTAVAPKAHKALQDGACALLITTREPPSGDGTA